MAATRPQQRRPWAVIAHAMLVSLAVSASDSISAPVPETLLPYIPATILVPAAGSSAADAGTAYILIPGSTGPDPDRSVDLVALNISSSLASSSLSGATTTLTSGLPFLAPSASNTTTFSPTLAYDGSIIAYVGDCSSATASSSVWVYNTSSSSAPWTQLQNASSATTSPQFLGGGVAFSEVIAPSPSAPQVYAYGGQCPDAALNGTTWVNGADYSNSMVRLQLSSSSSSDDDIDGEYEAETMSLAAAPVAEAGFSWTSLRPSTSNISGTVTQGVNSVVLGGHTRSAFVNMSTAAVWTLPEESWSYVTISGPAASTSSSSPVEVQSRSGHTAVLNEAGTSLVILGGWVGNTSQAATPQLVILDMYESAFGEWMWVVPEKQPLADGQGIYGHGAALLPGNVMMVAGGYSIPSSSSSSSSSKVRARDSGSDTIRAAGGALPMFLNLTSLSWSDSYTNPSSTSSSSSSTSSSNATKLGLEIGLGAGIPVLLLLVCLAVFCICRHRRRHAHRDAHIRGLTAGGAFITSEEMLASVHDLHDPLYQQQHPWVPKAAARWYSYTGGHDPYLRGEKSAVVGYEDVRGEGGQGQPTDYSYNYNNNNNTNTNNNGYYYNAPGAYRGTLGRRKPNPRVAQGLYQLAGVDESRAMAVITPIMEDEEDEELAMHGAMSPDKDMEGADEDHLGGRDGHDDENVPFIVPGAHMPPPHSPTAAEVGAGVQNTTTSSLDINRAPTPIPLISGPPNLNAQPTQIPAQPQPQDPEVTGWVTDVDVSDALITRHLQHPHRTSSTNSASAARMLGGAGPGGRLSPIRGGPLARNPSVRFSDGELTPTATTPGGRTESNLSESNRSAFSFVPNRSDSFRRGSAASGSAAGLLSVGGPDYYSNKRGGTSHSDHSSSGTSSGGASFITAKSIPALRSEGPGLLLQLGRPRPVSGIEDVTNMSEGDEPGSPSKSKPPRRSWFGSLRRVFSSGPSSHSSGSGSGADSMRTESPTQGDSNDYDRFGLGSLGLGSVGGMLQKRKQGRWAWNDGNGDSSSQQQSQSYRRQSGVDERWEEEGDGEWDIERAVEQRLVQVMFSVPKERLRIVNGEPDLVSIEESVVVVDPEQEEEEDEDEEERREREEDGEGRDKGKGRADEPVVAGTPAYVGHDVNENNNDDEDDDNENEYIRTPDTADELRTVANDNTVEVGRRQQQQQHHEPGDTAPLLLIPSKASFESASNERTKQDEQTQKTRQLLLDVPQLQHHLRPPPRAASFDSSISGESADSATDSPARQRSVSPGVPMQAEAVRFERRRTRVLDLVETFEQRSRSTSPVKEADRGSSRQGTW